MEKPNGQICNVFGSRNNKDRRTRIRSFSVFGPNTPILQYSNTPDLHPLKTLCLSKIPSLAGKISSRVFEVKRGATHGPDLAIRDINNGSFLLSYRAEISVVYTAPASESDGLTCEADNRLSVA